MLLFKWFAIPSLVLIFAIALALTRCFDSTWVSVTFAVAAITTLCLWRKASYGLSGSIKNIDPEQHDRRLFQIIFAVTFALSLLLMLATLLALIVLPAIRTQSGFTMAFTLMAWSSIVRFGAMNVLSHFLIHKRHTTS